MSKHLIRMLWWLPWLAISTAVWAAADPAPQPPAKVALVIGNGAYEDKPLANAPRDAVLMAETLERLGFAVTRRDNLNRDGLFASLREFAERIPPGAVAMVYFAGHGLQVSGANYLMPVDMVPTSERGVGLKAYPLKALLDRLAEAPGAVNLVVLDACRNNPFQQAAPSRYRNLANLGLARVTLPKGTFIAYSTAPGQLAEDGQGRSHSLYTEALAQEMQQPGRTVEQIFKQVAETVRKKTLDDQQPWYDTSLVGELYFLPPANVRMLTTPPAQKLAEAGGRGTKRGMGAQDTAKSSQPAWYRQLNEAEWSNLDWEIELRVSRLTRDELPGLERRADTGNVVAQTTLGLAWREGVDKITVSGSNRVLRSGSSNVKAVAWLKRAAQAGFPIAQTELAEMYFRGRGVERNPAQAMRLFRQAAAAHYPRARIDLAQAELELNPNNPEAMGRLLRSALDNSLKAMQAPAGPAR